jgi:hypothetical protein
MHQKELYFEMNAGLLQSGSFCFLHYFIKITISMSFLRFSNRQRKIEEKSFSSCCFTIKYILFSNLAFKDQFCKAWRLPLISEIKHSTFKFWFIKHDKLLTFLKQKEWVQISEFLKNHLHKTLLNLNFILKFWQVYYFTFRRGVFSINIVRTQQSIINLKNLVK